MRLSRSMPAAVVFAALLGSALPAAAQSSGPLGELLDALRAPAIPPAAQIAPALNPLPLVTTPHPPPPPAGQRFEPRDPGRPGWLYGLHAATLVVQSLDVHSTLTALDRGAVEVNPILSDIANHPPTFIAVKTGLAAGLIYGTDRMARRHPVRALLLSAAISSAYAVVVAHNYRVARTLR